MPPLDQISEHPAIYARVSMDRGKLSESVRDQVNRAKPRCAALGWGEPVVYRDNDVSATKNVVRLGFERLLRAIADEKVDGIIVRHLDRLLRQQKDLDRLKDIIRERGDYVPITMIEGPTFDLRQAQDLFLVTLLVGFGTMESDVKRERVRDARKRDAKSGKPPPRMGYGYNEKHKIVPAEAKVIREATDRILDGEPLRAVVTDFNNRDVPSPGAGKWVAEVVRRAVEVDDRPVVRELIQILRREEPQDPAAVASLLRKAGSGWTARDVRESYEYDQHLEADDHGAPDSAIARLFRQAGVPAPRTYWSTRTLRNILWRGTISGVRDFEEKRKGSKTNGEPVAVGKWTPIIEPETHQRLRDVLEGRKAGPSPDRSRHRGVIGA